jgi:hypothetical protein
VESSLLARIAQHLGLPNADIYENLSAPMQRCHKRLLLWPRQDKRASVFQCHLLRIQARTPVRGGVVASTRPEEHGRADACCKVSLIAENR